MKSDSDIYIQVAEKKMWLNCRIPSHFEAIPLKQWLGGYIATQLRGGAVAWLCGLMA